MGAHRKLTGGEAGTTPPVASSDCKALERPRVAFPAASFLPPRVPVLLPKPKSSGRVRSRRREIQKGCAATGADAWTAWSVPNCCRSERDGHLPPDLRRGPDVAGLVAGAARARPTNPIPESEAARMIARSRGPAAIRPCMAEN